MLLNRVAAAARRALLLTPLAFSIASAQATLGGLTLRGTGAGFGIVDLTTQSSSLVMAGFTSNIGPTVQNQTVAVRLNRLTHSWIGDLTIRVNFLSAALGTNHSWTLLAQPGSDVVGGGFNDDFTGDYAFGEFDLPNTLYQRDLYDYAQFGPTAVVPTGDYFAFDGQNYGSPGAIYGGLNPNGTWTLSIADAAGGDVGAVGSWDLAFNVLTNNTVVPEPSSFVLMGMGLAALVYVGRRRRSA